LRASALKSVTSPGRSTSRYLPSSTALTPTASHSANVTAACSGTLQPGTCHTSPARSDNQSAIASATRTVSGSVSHSACDASAPVYTSDQPIPPSAHPASARSKNPPTRTAR